METAVDIHAELSDALRAGNLPDARVSCDALGVVIHNDHDEKLRQSGRVTHLEALVKQLKTELKSKEERVAQLTHELWAKSSETFESPAKEDGSDSDDGKQNENGGGSEDEDGQRKRGKNNDPKNYAANSPAEPKPSNGRGPTDWSCFDHVDAEYTGPTECPCGCGGTIRSYYPQKRLILVPEYYYVEVTEVPKFRCQYDFDGAERMKTMCFEPTLLPETNISSSVLAYHLTQRFGWGLPWHRIETMMRYAGWHVYRSTLMRRANKTAEAVMGVYWALMDSVLGDRVRVFIDETPIPILKPGKGQTGTAYMYAVHRDDRSFGGNLPPATVYASRTSRAMYHIHDLLADRSLIVHHDGYSGYGQFGTAGSVVAGILSVGCWTHARRNFIKYYETTTNDETGSATAAEIIELINLIYKIDGKNSGWPPDDRRQHRQENCKPVVDKLRQRLKEIKASISTGSALTKAINYVDNRWEGLTRFLNDGHMELDTNAVERQFKPIQNLRKNVYFMGSEEGGETWAVFSSLIETCKLNGVDPYKYLVWLFDEFAQIFARKTNTAIDHRDFLPWNAPSTCTVGFKEDREIIAKAA